MSAETQRKAYRYNCNMIRPQLYSEKSLMESVVDFFSDVVPQAYSQQKVEDKEKIQWVRFENCDCSDIARNPDLFKYDTKGLPLLLILGYSNGVQIWHITPNGEALEILSIRQGPVKICRILPNPEPVFGYTDSFSSKRPLIVMCDSSSAGQPFCGMKFVSLKTGDEVHSVSFKTLPVHNIECNERFLVATFLEKVCVYEACRFKQLFWITSCYPCPGPNVNPIALSARWLAYADRRLVPMHQSCGGMSGDGTQSYAATVISAAKGAFKGLSMFGEAMVNSMTGCKPSGSKKQHEYVQLDNGNRPGIVTVVDIQNIHNDHFNVNEDNEGSGLIAHFHAHANEPVADMAFDPTGTLLVTACKLGHNFHIFRLMAHPCSSSLGAVHHLYTLHRGDTTAKVIDIGFNHDSRWVTVSTHRGTTHVFAITPYGGIPNMRTHCQPFVVNRASRFHRSAGLEDIEHSPLGRRSPVLSTSPSSSGHYDRYPTLIQQNTLNNNMGNPRLPPYPHPITLYPLFQIKQPLNVVLNPANKNMSPNHSPNGVDNIFAVASRFCTPRLCVVGSPKLDVERREAGKRPVDCLFIMAQSGTLVEYVLEPKARTVSEKVHDESMLELNVVGRMQWNLQRLKTSNELRPPLPTNSPLILSHEAVVSQVQTAPEYYDLPGLTRHDSKDSLSSDHSGKDEDEWVSQVEIITHAGPHRRLWMGPQFSFKTYQENTTVLSSHSSSLLSQSSETNMVAMDITGEEGDLESLRVQPMRSNPVSMPNARPAYRRLSSDSSPSPGLSGHSAPLLIEAGSFDQSPHLLDVYSNWTESTVEKQPRGSDDIEEDKIKETLADAMVESPMRDMEKLSFRQEMTRAGGRKGMTDHERKKNMEMKIKEKKETGAKGNNMKVDTRDKKLEKTQTSKQEVEVKFPVKSESILTKPVEKGRTKTFDKTVSDKQLACVPECCTDKQVDKIDENSALNKHNNAAPNKEQTNKVTTKEKVEQVDSVEQTSVTSKQNSDEKINEKAKNGKKKRKSKAVNKDDETGTIEPIKDENTSLKYKSEEILPKKEMNISASEIKSNEFIKTKDTEEKNFVSNDKETNDLKNAQQLDTMSNDLGENIFGCKADIKQTHNDPCGKIDEPEVSVDTLNKDQKAETTREKDDANSIVETKDIDTDLINNSVRNSTTSDRQEAKNKGSKKQKKGRDKKKETTKTEDKVPTKHFIVEEKCIAKNKLAEKVIIEGEQEVVSNQSNLQDTDKELNDHQEETTTSNYTQLNQKDTMPEKNTVVLAAKPKCLDDEDTTSENVWVIRGKKKKEKKQKSEVQKDNESNEGNVKSLSVIEDNQDKEDMDGHCTQNTEVIGQRSDIENCGFVIKDNASDQESSNENQKFDCRKDSNNDAMEDLNEVENLNINEEDKCEDSWKVTENTDNKDDIHVPISGEKLAHEQIKLTNMDCLRPEKRKEMIVEPIMTENKKLQKKKRGNQQTGNEKSKCKKEETTNAQPTSSFKEQDNGSSDIEIIKDGKALIEQNDIPIVSELISQSDSQTGEGINLSTESQNIDRKSLNLGILEIPLERTGSLERSPSFESVRSTFSEERGQVKNDGTDSELLASTEQSDNDMIEVKSKKKKRKKKIEMEESLYYEASEPETPQQNKQITQHSGVFTAQLEKATENDSEISNILKPMDDLSIQSSETTNTGDEKVVTFKGDEKESCQEQETKESENGKFIVNTKRSRKNKKSQVSKNVIDEYDNKPESTNTLEERRDTPEQEIQLETDFSSTEITPVNSEDLVKVSSLKIDLKIPIEDATAWEAAAKSKSGESQSCDEYLNVDKTETSTDNKTIVEETINEKECIKNSAETSNSSGRSSEERDLDSISPTKPIGGESKNKKKRKKNKK